MKEHAINGVAEDLGAILGYTAATRLMEICGGKKIYIPQTPIPSHRLCLILGEAPFSALCREFGGELIKIPGHEEGRRMSRLRAVADLVSAGWTVQRIADAIGVSQRQIARDRSDAERYGLISMVAHG